MPWLAEILVSNPVLTPSLALLSIYPKRDPSFLVQQDCGGVNRWGTARSEPSDFRTGLVAEHALSMREGLGSI
jgi:hypothetical protein